MVPFVRARDHLDTIPGVGRRAAESTIAEIGIDMSVFSSTADGTTLGHYMELPSSCVETAPRSRTA
jgi:hypothetical protein